MKSQKDQKRKINLFIAFVLMFTILTFPLISLVVDFYPFSSLPMFALERLPACGYLISDQKGGTIHLNSFSQARLLHRYLQPYAQKKDLSSKNCTYIRDQFLPNKANFIIDYLCLMPEDILASKLKPNWSIHCT